MKLDEILLVILAVVIIVLIGAALFAHFMKFWVCLIGG
jgi:hypothetical protein